MPPLQTKKPNNKNSFKLSRYSGNNKKMYLSDDENDFSLFKENAGVVVSDTVSTYLSKNFARKR